LSFISAAIPKICHPGFGEAKDRDPLSAAHEVFAAASMPALFGHLRVQWVPVFACAETGMMGGRPPDGIDVPSWP